VQPQFPILIQSQILQKLNANIAPNISSSIAPNLINSGIYNPQQPLASPFPHIPESGFGHLPQQIPFQQAGFANTNMPCFYPPQMYPPQAPAFQLHPQLLVYPPPNHSFPPNQQMYAVPHLYVKFPENVELRKKIDEISMIVFKVIFEVFQNL